MYEKVTNIYAYQWGTVPRKAFYNPAVKYDPSEKLLHVYKRDNKETLQQFKRVPLHLKPQCPSNFVPVFQRHWRAQTVRICSCVRLFYFTYSTASWLQMAGVCSGLTEPAVGGGHMLTSLAACVGATAAHSYRRWKWRAEHCAHEWRELLWCLLLNKC